MIYRKEIIFFIRFLEIYFSSFDNRREAILNKIPPLHNGITQKEYIEVD